VQRGVDQAAAMVADARAGVKSAQEQVDEAKSSVDAAMKDVDNVCAAAALQPKNKNLSAVVERNEVWLQKAEAWLQNRQAWLKDREERLRMDRAWLEQARAADAARRPFELPAEFPHVAPNVALQQLGALAQSKRFEVPTRALEEVTRHVRTLRDLFGRPVDKSVIPNLVVTATGGSGKTTLLRYLQQTADTVRYGAELQSDTNWLAKGWNNTTRSGVEKAAAQSVPALRHVFVGFATFNQGADVMFDKFIDTEATIERRYARRILYDAGLAPRKAPNFDLDLTETAKALRAQISAAKGCEPDEVAIVFLLDGTTRITEGPRRVLLNAIAAWQQRDLADGRLSVSVVGGVSLFDMGDQWRKCSRPIAALQLLPLVALPRELAAEIATDARLDRSRKLELLGCIGAAGGHPLKVECVVDAMKDPRLDVGLHVAYSNEEFACVWDVFATNITAGGYLVDARDLATAPKYALHRSLLAYRILREHPATSDAHALLPMIVLTATPSALFLTGACPWTGARFPSYDAVVAVRALMQATDGIARKWGPAFAGALHLMAQCVLYARRKQATATLLPGQAQDLRGSVRFEDLVPGAIIGGQCADLRYVVREAFAHTVDHALTRADFQKLRDASCLHSQPKNQAVADSAFAAECGGEAVVVAAQHKLDGDASEQQVDEWFDAAAEFMRGQTESGNFRVLLCVNGLSQEALDTIKKRAANKDDCLSRAIIIDAASASQLFERFGLWTCVEALKYCS
jgi:hypothetical protein